MTLQEKTIENRRAVCDGVSAGTTTFPDSARDRYAGEDESGISIFLVLMETTILIDHREDPGDQGLFLFLNPFSQVAVMEI